MISKMVAKVGMLFKNLVREGVEFTKTTDAQELSPLISKFSQYQGIINAVSL